MFVDLQHSEVQCGAWWWTSWNIAPIIWPRRPKAPEVCSMWMKPSHLDPSPKEWLDLGGLARNDLSSPGLVQLNGHPMRRSEIRGLTRHISFSTMIYCLLLILPTAHIQPTCWAAIPSNCRVTLNVWQWPLKARLLVSSSNKPLKCSSQKSNSNWKQYLPKPMFLMCRRYLPKFQLCSRIKFQ